MTKSLLQVQIPSTGAWFYATRNVFGQLTFSIYSTRALPGSEMTKCQEENKGINFRISEK